jgi:electron transport complex protein RnfB
MTISAGLFERLSTLVGAPGSKRFARVLEAMMTPDEARILLELKTPLSTPELAARMNVDAGTLQAALDEMDQRQIVRKGSKGYFAPTSIVAFHHGAIGWMREELKARVYPLWGEFFYAEWRDILVDEFERRRQNGGPGAHRVVPAYRALKASPRVRPEQILWYEDMEQVLRRAERISFMMCGCRGLWRQCDNPIDTCLKVQFKTSPEFPNKEPAHFIKPPKDVSLVEALEIIDDCEERGLVHIPLNTSKGDMYCSCCDDCCMVINPLLHRQRVHEILAPSRYRAAVDRELCSGCQTCLERCKFAAIEMAPVPGSKKLKAQIVSEHCLGCGACVITCPKQALTLELVRPPEHIPTVTPLELFQMGRKT